MKRPIYLFLFLLSFYSIISLAQNEETPYKLSSEFEIIDARIQEYKYLASSDPDKAVKKLLEVKELCKTGAMKNTMGLVLLYYNKW